MIKRALGCSAIALAGATIALLIGGALASLDTPPSGAVDQAVATDAGITSTPRPSSSGTAPASSTPATAAHVTYSCTGTAPDGVDITYGPNGSNYSASSLPFSKTVPLPATAEYVNVTAQLQGSGDVTCTTAVQASDGTVVTQTGVAQGGYNIASAEVCSSFDGTWQVC